MTRGRQWRHYVSVGKRQITTPTEPPSTAFFDEVNAYDPEHWWRCQDASSPITDDGTVGVNLTADATNPPLYEQAGPLGGTQTSKSLGFVSAGDDRIYNAGTDIILSAGFFFALVKLGSSGDAFQTIFALGNPAGGNQMRFDVQESNGAFRYRYTHTGGSYILLHTSSVVDLTDGSWHSVCVVQPGDTTGVDVYIDGVDITANMTPTGPSGTVSLDDWFFEMAGQTAVDRIAIGSTTNTVAANSLEGNISEIVIASDILTPTNVTDLHNAAGI